MINHWKAAAVCASALPFLTLGVSMQAQAAKRKTTTKSKTTIKKVVNQKSGVQVDDGIVIISGGGDISVSGGTTSYGSSRYSKVASSTRTSNSGIKISKPQKFTPQMLAAMQKQAVKKVEAREAVQGIRTIAKRVNRAMPPAFNVADTRSRKVSLDQYRGKVLVLDFWATWCPPCVAEAPDMVALYNKYRGQGMDMVGVSLDSDAQKLESFTRANKMPWRQIFGGKNWESDLAKLYKVPHVPYPVVIARDGTVFAAGPRGAQLEQAVVAALAER